MIKTICSAVVLAMVSGLPVLAQYWSLKTPSSSPPPSLYGSMAYDAGNSQVLLFGGASVSPSMVPVGTWTWSGTNWQERYPATFDFWSLVPGMAAWGNDVLMAGGLLSSGLFTGTWKWSSNAWSRVDETAPLAAVNATIVMSPFSGNTVVAYQVAPGGASETWVWNGAWTKANVTSPSARMGPSMAYDSSRNRVVLFGGKVFESYPDVLLADTWEWDGTNWTQQTPVHSPPARALGGMAYDAAAGTTVLFGGVTITYDGQTCLNDTWTWNGTDWTQHTLSTAPSPRAAPMAYDAARGQVVLFGGGAFNADGGMTNYGDTWVWSGLPTPYTAQVQQPIKLDGTSVFNANRGVVPVKFKLMANGAPTCTLPPATIAVQRTSDGTITSIEEAIYMHSADVGSNFRVDAPNCQYIYNLAVSSLGAGSYTVQISVEGAVVGSASFGLK